MYHTYEVQEQYEQGQGMEMQQGPQQEECSAQQQGVERKDALEA